MAHQSDKRIKGIVVVRKDSDISNLEQLDGQMLAFPDVSASQREKLARALVSLDDSEQGAQLLVDLGFAGIQLADDASWDDVRDLNIRSLETSDNTLAEQDQ